MSDKFVRHTINGVEVVRRKEPPPSEEYRYYRIVRPKTEDQPEEKVEISNEGLHKFYYDNGTLGWRYTIKDGLEEGKWLSWNSNGQIECRQFFKEGKRQEEAKHWHEGRLWERVIYKDDQVIAASEGANRFFNKGKPWYEGDINLV